MNILRSTKQFPKPHLIAVCSCITMVSLALVLVPSTEVAAERSNQRTVITLQGAETTTPTVQAQSQSSSDNAKRTETAEEAPLTLAMVSPQPQPKATPDETTAIAEAATAEPEPEPENWLRIKVRSGDNLTTLFKKAGLGPNELYPLLNGIKPQQPFRRLMPGQYLEFLIQEGSLEKIRLEKDALQSIVISKTEQGYKTEEQVRVPDVRHVHKAGTIEQSLFLAGQQAGLSQTKIMELAGIFGWDIDFVLDIRKGDRFSIIYEELLLDGKVIKDGNIIAAEFTNQDRSFRAIRYTDSKGNSNYYTPEGDSMRKAFLRTPVDFTRISSRFNPNRRHPIFKTKRPHRGVDYAAPSGTPIKTAGDGKVIFAGRKGGYGKVVIVQHGQNYTTLYAHMSRIKPGMRQGKRVKQGQTIGYVGSTGYATGPHLHYEFRVGGVHRNPLTVKLPHAAPLPKQEHAEFKPLAQELVAQLETLSQTQIASK